MSGVYNVCICIYFLVYFIHYYKYYVMKKMQYNMYIYTYAKGGSSNANILNCVCCLKQAAQFECECQADAKSLTVLQGALYAYSKPCSFLNGKTDMTLKLLVCSVMIVLMIYWSWYVHKKNISFTDVFLELVKKRHLKFDAIGSLPTTGDPRKSTVRTTGENSRDAEWEGEWWRCFWCFCSHKSTRFFLFAMKLVFVSRCAVRTLVILWVSGYFPAHVWCQQISAPKTVRRMDQKSCRFTRTRFVCFI